MILKQIDNLKCFKRFEEDGKGSFRGYFEVE